MTTQIMYNVVLTTPVMALDEFAKLSGLKSDEADYEWKQGRIPKAKMFGKRRMVNMLKLAEQCQKAEF